MTNSPQIVLQARARLGEGPVWDPDAGVLYWVDIYNYRVHRFTPSTGENRTYDVGDTVGCIALAEEGQLLVALRHHVAMLDTGTGELRALRDAEVDTPDGRLNDGKVDSSGRFWFGSMSSNEGEAALYRYDPDGTLRQMESGLTISNGLGWSPDDETFYLTDTPARTIYAYRYNAATGTISDRRVFADLTHQDAFPDGLAVDADGCVWSAQWDGGCIIRFATDGREIRRIAVPVPNPTSCAFGGSDLRDLYITSASVGMSQEEIDRSVCSGDLFCVRTDVAGLPVHRFGRV